MIILQNKIQKIQNAINQTHVRIILFLTTKGEQYRTLVTLKILFFVEQENA